MVKQFSTYSLITMGCPKNQADSDVLEGQLLHAGLERIEDPGKADVILVNTCGFIQDAKQESIEAILEAVQIKKKDSRKKVYVWGCLSERYRDEIGSEIPEVDGFFGIEPFEPLVRLIADSRFKWKESRSTRRRSHTPHSAYLKIADGCDHACTFCAIPRFKGPFKSRPLKVLTGEAKALAERGVRELNLVAQDSSQYGRDLAGGCSLPRLLEALLRIDGLDWIRLLYTHPAHVTGDLIGLMAGEPRICRYLDMPLQHVSDKVLRAMGRGTPRRSIESLIETLRARVPGIVMRTAFIVGFPGETQDDFQELVRFVEKTRFERMGVFQYSSEEGTPSRSMPGKVTRRETRRRHRELMELQREISGELNSRLRGRTIPAMIDGFDTDMKLFEARGEGDAPEVDQTIWIRGDVPVGKIVPVTVQDSTEYDLYGIPATADV